MGLLHTDMKTRNFIFLFISLISAHILYADVIDWTSNESEIQPKEYSKYLKYEQNGDSQNEKKVYRSALKDYQKADEGYLINDDLKDKIAELKKKKINRKFPSDPMISSPTEDTTEENQEKPIPDIWIMSAAVLVSTWFLFLKLISKIKVR
ncbi:hypothetical protein [Leptospira yasudae]|uniref:Uncharacterized protein n=1 Tax=Leptospira yasudae TaxID=2202201 RepID=A0ABX9LZ64_9LEPT|nr:hypothetical protein [Leptospira yasudae]RHX77499.1 hypothetical protein DLM77_20995 [Leptospira yasudae]TGM04725.1 hypothetical protein EHQ86_11035 [Leptospira yasudae]